MKNLFEIMYKLDKKLNNLIRKLNLCQIKEDNLEYSDSLFLKMSFV